MSKVSSGMQQSLKTDNFDGPRPLGRCFVPMVQVDTERADCIGSECMAWRWANPIAGSEKEPMGYCGLAGGTVTVDND